MLKVNKNNLETEVIKASLPGAVKFSSEWCPACQKLKPIFEELEPEYDGKIIFGEVDVTVEQELAEASGVLSIPQIFLYKDGAEAERLVGYLTKEELKQKLDSLL